MPRDDEVMEEERVLDRIVHHRVATNRKGAVDDDDDDSSKMEYQCAWKGHDEPTWVPRSTLDNDYIKELVAYDNAVATKRAAANQPPAAAKTNGKKPSKSALAQANAPPGLDEDHPYGDTRCISDLCGFDINAPITTPNPVDGTDWSAQVYGCGVCVTDEQIASFMRLYEELQATHTPVIVYHGNELRNLPKICKEGFVVPKTEKDVGYTQYGKCIFASFKLDDCAVYCKAKDSDMRVLCCAALISDSDRDTNIRHNSYVLFKRAELILPVWALDIAVESNVGYASLMEHRAHSYSSLGAPYPHTEKHKLK